MKPEGCILLYKEGSPLCNPVGEAIALKDAVDCVVGKAEASLAKVAIGDLREGARDAKHNTFIPRGIRKRSATPLK